MQMAQNITQQEQQENDESHKSLIISVDVEQQTQTNEEVIATESDLPLHNSIHNDESHVTNPSLTQADSSSSGTITNSTAGTSKGAKSKIPSKTKTKSKENSQQLSTETISRIKRRARNQRENQQKPERLQLTIQPQRKIPLHH
jgi:hypothetical protein